MGLSKPPANITTTVTWQLQAGAPFRSSAKAFPPSGAENSSCTTLGGAPQILPQTQTHNPGGQLCRGDILAWVAQG